METHQQWSQEELRYQYYLARILPSSGSPSRSAKLDVSHSSSCCLDPKVYRLMRVSVQYYLNKSLVLNADCLFFFFFGYHYVLM